MTDIMDDLLEEVEQLEQSTQELETAAQKTTNQKQQLDDATSQSTSEVHLLALETSKTAQEAAVQSHQAAQIAIKQAELLKEQELELNESNFNWRQAVRNANKELQAAKSSFSMMLITAIVVSIIAIGALGYLFYAMQKQDAQFKGEVLDMVATENTLLNKQITLKMDELASVIEMLTHQVSQVQIPTPKSTDSLQPIESKSDSKADLIEKTTEQSKPQQKTVQTTNDDALTTKASEEKPATPEKITHAESLTPNTVQNAITAQEYTELKKLIENVLSEQKTLQAKMPKTSAAAKGLSADQIKKLNDISWLVRKQAKTLTAIETKIGLKQNSKTAESNRNNVLKEIKNLQLQQSTLQKQLLEIHKALKKYADQANASYSYKAK